jgi:hypothetical protein
MDDLLELNKQGLFEDLDELTRINNTDIKCNDLIELLSTAQVRDKRLINKYSDDEIYTKMIKTGKYKRKCRIFTPKGIERYLHEGKLFNYENTCAYFSVKPKDKELKIVKQLVKDGEVLIKKTLKWLYGKRKSIKWLGDTQPIEEFISWLEEDEYEDMIEEKKKKFITFYKQISN